MDNDVIELIEQLLISNKKLRQQADAGEWDVFLDESEIGRASCRERV